MASLGADVEMDEELDIPLSTTQAGKKVDELELLQFTTGVQGLFDSSASIPYFFPPANSVIPQEYRQTETAGAGGRGPAGGGAGARNAYEEDTQKEDWTSFWRQETDEEMKAIWEKDRLELTREWKKRHREAKKHRKRRGGNGAEDFD